MEQPKEQKQTNRVTFWGSIQNRLILSFLLVGLIMLALVGITVSQIGNILSKDNYVIEKVQPTQIYAYYLSSEVKESNLLLHIYLFDKVGEQSNKEERNIIWEDKILPLQDSLKQFSKSWESLEARMIFASIETNLFELRRVQEKTEKLADNTLEYDSLNNKIKTIDGKITDNPILNPFKSFDETLSLIKALDKDIADLASIQQKVRFQKINVEVAQSLTVFVWIEIIIVVLALLVAFLLSSFLIRSLKRSVKSIRHYLDEFSLGNVPWVHISYENEIMALTDNLTTFAKNLQKITDFATEVGKGNFESDISVFKNKGDIGASLAELRSGLAQVAIEDKQRNWINEGIALFSNILRNTDSQKTYDEFIANLVRYVEANQGSIFVVQGTDKNAILELKAIYAYDRKRFVNKSIKMGQGLVGQTWQDKDLVYLEEVPDNFVQINSGFGEAPPKSILIVPIMMNEEYLGAIELASFKKFEQYQIEFVQRTAEILVSLVSAIKKTEETEVLLQESQDKAELMKAQEEELKLTVEQLETTQQQIVQNQIELKGQKQALDQILITVEFDMNGRILSANDIFLQAMKYENLDSVVGLPHEVLIPPQDRVSEKYINLWKNLKKGLGFTGEVKRITKEGLEVWLSATYTVVKDEEGNFLKVIKIANEITQEKQRNLDFARQLEAINRANAIVEFDINGYIKTANNLYLKMVGYTLEELRGKHHRLLIPEEEKALKEEAVLWRRIQRGETMTGDFRRQPKDGKDIWLYGSYNVILDMNNNPYKVVKFAHDITASVELEKQKNALTKEKQILTQRTQELNVNLRKNKEKIENLQTQYKEAYLEQKNYLNIINQNFLRVEFTPRGTVRDCTKSFAQVLEYEEISDLIGFDKNRIFDFGTEDIDKVWGNMIKKMESKQATFTLITKTNGRIELKGSLNPIQDIDKNLSKLILVAY